MRAHKNFNLRQIIIRIFSLSKIKPLKQTQQQRLIKTRPANKTSSNLTLRNCLNLNQHNNNRHLYK